MKHFSAILLLVLTIMSCGKEEKEVENPRPIGLAFFFRPIPTSYIELDMSEPIQIPLQILDAESYELNIEYRCREKCTPALHVDQNGILHWNPHKLPPEFEAPFMNGLHVRATDPWNEYMSDYITLHIDNYRYRLGDHWTRIQPSHPDFLALPDRIQNYKHVIASQKGATGSPQGSVTYLGKFSGKHLVITNKHVLSFLESNDCHVERVFKFGVPGIDALCDSLVIAGQGIDYAILSIKGDNENLEILRKSTPTLITNIELKPRTKLIVAGNGRYRNPYAELTFNTDDDCQIFAAEVRYVKNYGDIGMISCDVSPGDSGGPVILRESGEMIGILQSITRGEALNSSQRLNEAIDLTLEEKENYRHTNYLPFSAIKKDIENQLPVIEDASHRKALEDLLASFSTDNHGT